MKSGKNRPDRKGRKPRALSRPVRTSEKRKPKSAKGKARKGARSSKLDPRSRNPAAFLGGAGLLAAIVQSSDAAIIGKTLDGIVTSWNPSAERIFGYTAARDDRQADPCHCGAGAGPSEMGEILDRIRRGERVEQLRDASGGGRMAASIQISLTVSPILTSSGRIVGASKIAHDITASKTHGGAAAGQVGAARGIHPCAEPRPGHGADARRQDPVLGSGPAVPLRLVGGGGHRTHLP